MRSGFGLALRLLGLGWYIALSIILGVAGGLWLDGVMGTRPLFTLVGVILGSALAFYGVYKMVLPLLGEDETATKP